jgi:hypothetical protein
LTDSLAKKFEELMEGKDEINDAVHAAQELIDDLTVVMDDVVPCYPPRYRSYR